MDVAPGGGGSHDPGLEARVTRLEDQFGRIETLLRGIDDRVRLLEMDVSEIKGRLYNLPGIWPIMTAIAGGQATLALVLFGALKITGH